MEHGQCSSNRHGARIGCAGGSPQLDLPVRTRVCGAPISLFPFLLPTASCPPRRSPFCALSASIHRSHAELTTQKAPIATNLSFSRCPEFFRPLRPSFLSRRVRSSPAGKGSRPDCLFASSATVHRRVASSTAAVGGAHEHDLLPLLVSLRPIILPQTPLSLPYGNGRAVLLRPGFGPAHDRLTPSQVPRDLRHHKFHNFGLPRPRTNSTICSYRHLLMI